MKNLFHHITESFQIAERVGDIERKEFLKKAAIFYYKKYRKAKNPLQFVLVTNDNISLLFRHGMIKGIHVEASKSFHIEERFMHLSGFRQYYGKLPEFNYLIDEMSKLTKDSIYNERISKTETIEQYLSKPTNRSSFNNMNSSDSTKALLSGEKFDWSLSDDLKNFSSIIFHRKLGCNRNCRFLFKNFIIIIQSHFRNPHALKYFKA